MPNRKTFRLDLFRVIAERQIDFLTETKTFMRVHSFDELAVVLFIAARTKLDAGVTERQISEGLSVPRSTINRHLKRLVDGGQVTILAGTSPRQYIDEEKFSANAYGKKAESVRGPYYATVLRSFADMYQKIILNLVDSHFDNRSN